ncbi:MULTISPECIES: lactaldehyde reductase [unclassified Gilliamella]|uniref:lactaldehyde reductase n=1 Tax=unclassified Gilliamella TaxID=2685620 RepID=UPI00226A7FEF|nr:MULTISPECIES: lactaldehyde reductase [unclassified Gilliamella]MCX8641140.1 lactaldehyde reductase [Gilliamella sp. B3835]MCX8707101.1 lactaldehyde reductase [Gilliamella sp. B3783]MCX8710402.1 lactaldehyde reductase [Gilliamella sp. B3780]MCX8715084.1 lactaldehyde reductase [Gilliamella sp. B3781]MCX8716084.1 lactaldehyde reductase [Gilliamella sp. B3784]
MAYRMILNETSYFGAGSIQHIVDEIKKRGFKKALVVTDKDLIKFKVATKVTKLLDDNGFAYQIFDQVMPNPTIGIVKKGVDIFKQSGADYLIAIGGGSPQDTAKAIGIIINNPEFADVRSLEGVAPTKKPAVPTIAIPTTAGTAAEVTINYVITDEEKKRKFVCVDPHDIPAVAIIDSDMMTSMPASLKAATGVDALTHAIEGYITKGAWELSDMFHLKAIEVIARSLRDSVKGIAKGSEDMALGQYIAGMGFSNVGLGLVHGMAHPLGAFYSTPHGVANAVLLPHIMAYNAEFTGDKYRDIAKAMGVAGTEKMTIAQARQAAVDAVKQLNKDVGIPETLKDIGVKLEDIPALAQAAFDDVCTGGNPRETNVHEIEQLYQAIY